MTIAKGHREVPYKLRVMDSHPPRSYHRSALKSSQTFHLTLDHTATKTQPLMIAVPPRSREVAGLELCNVTVRLVTAAEREAAERLQQQEAEEQRRTSSRPLKRSRSSSDRGGVVEPKQQPGGTPTSTPPPRQEQQEHETVVVVVWLALLDATGRRLPEVPDFPLASFTFSPSASALSTNNVRTSKISLPMCPGQRVTVYLSTTTSGAGAGQNSPLVLCTLTGTGYLNHPSEEDDDDDEGDEHDDDRRTTRRRRRGGGGDHSDVFGKMLKGGDVAGPKALERLLSTLPPSPSSPTAEGSGEREDGKLLSSEPPLDGVSRQASDPQQQQQRSGGSRRRDELSEKKEEKTSSFPSEDEEVPTLTYAFVAGSDSQS